MKKHFISFLLIPALLLLSIIPAATAYAAEHLCISQIKIEAGDGAAERLESGGFTVVYQNLNPAGGDRIYLGYKLGEKPLTDLIVSSEQKSTVTANSVSYTAVSSVNLNQGTNGKPVYLYATVDAKAGSGIVSLSCVKDNKDGETDLLEKFGDGSVPVRTTDGRAADFDEGIEKRDLYFFMIHENSCKPYVSDIKIVNVGSEENAFEKIAASGCNYFNRGPIAKTSDTSAYLCCNRTAEASDAVRFAAVSDNAEIDGITYQSAGNFKLAGEDINLYYTKDKAVGNPVSEITNVSLSRDSFTKGDWAKAYFSMTESSAMSQIYSEDAYSALIESDDEYAQLKIENKSGGAETGLYMILPAKGLATGKAEERVVTLPSEQNEEDNEMQRDTEITGIEKEETTEITGETKSSESVGSAIGNGSLIVIAVLAGIAVIAGLVIVWSKKRKSGKNV